MIKGQEESLLGLVYHVLCDRGERGCEEKKQYTDNLICFSLDPWGYTAKQVLFIIILLFTFSFLYLLFLIFCPIFSALFKGGVGRYGCSSPLSSRGKALKKSRTVC